MSGYTTCPECGNTTVSDDQSVPELCLICAGSLADILIQQSVHENSIVHTENVPGLTLALFSLCEGCSNEDEFHGITDDGDTWRIHVEGLDT